MPKIELQDADDRVDFLDMAIRHFRELNPRFVPAADWQEQYFDRIRGNPDFSLRWIVADNQRVGFVLFGVELHRFLPRSTGMVYELYIEPEFRRRGIAAGCAQLVVEELRKARPSKIQVEVIKGNAAAARLWHKLGFAKVSERLVLSSSAE